jgi:hypothetical protein
MIYFVQRPDSKNIKIGTTIRLSVRKVQLERQEGVTLEVLAVTDGGFVEEHILHEKFASCWTGNEWFRPSAPLLAFIERDCRPWDGTDEVPDNYVRANLHIRATQEWTDWVKEGAEHCRLSVSSVIDVALTRYFKDEGFAKKPPKR